ncbi:MAG: hypothetical protein R3B13_09670 [Polyangiaceae bacterium]
MKAPQRLSEGEGELAELLRAARADVPTAAQLEPIASHLSTLPAAAAATAGAGVAGGKVVALLVLTGGLMAGGIYAVIKTTPPRLTPAIPIVTQSAPAGELVAPRPSAEGAAEVTAPPSAEVAVSSGEAPPIAHSATRGSAPGSSEAAATKPSESSLLDAARRALSSNPAQALALTRRHQQLYPQGVLAQEREVIAMEALKRQGNEAAVRQRAAAFERSFPASPHKKKIGELQGAKP